MTFNNSLILVCSCMCACTHTHAHININTYIDEYMHTYHTHAHKNTHTDTHICIHKNICIHTCTQNRHTCTFTHTHLHRHAYTRMHIHIHTTDTNTHYTHTLKVLLEEEQWSFCLFRPLAGVCQRYFLCLCFSGRWLLPLTYIRTVFSVNCPVTALHCTEHKILIGQSLKSRELMIDAYRIVPLFPQLPSDLWVKAIP